MLNFKVGKTYKDTNGNDWVCIGYDETAYYPYRFRRLIDNLKDTFFEREDNSVTQQDDGRGAKIPFVEEKEREWVVGEEYECFDAVTQRVIKARLTKIIKKTDSHLVFIFHVNGLHFDFHFEGIVLVAGRYVVFKDGVPQELKDRINKGKLTNKQKCFQKEQIYKSEKGFEWKFKKRIKTEKGLVALFEDETSDVFSFSLYRLNNIECILTSHDTVAFCADESIRNGDGSKAVRVMQ